MMYCSYVSFRFLQLLDAASVCREVMHFTMVSPSADNHIGTGQLKEALSYLRGKIIQGLI
jgi:hypothetical protein